MKRYIMICAAALLSIICAQAESISVEDVVMDKGETKTVAISLTNSHTDLVSFQMDLYLPDGITLNKTGCSLSNRFGSTEELGVGMQSDGAYRLGFVSFSMTPISGTSGTIITLSLTASQTAMVTTASIQNIRFVTSNSERITISNTSFSINVRDDQTVSLSSLPSQIYGNTYNLPSQTDQGLPLTWTVTDSSVAMVSGNVLTATGVGTTTVTATQAGNNSYLPFTKTYTLTVNAKSASDLTISDIAAVTYNGSAQTPAITVKDGSTTLTSGTDYTVSYSNNTNVGTATVTVTGKGNYTGTKTATFTINAKSASSLTISEIAAVTYNGTAQTPAITVKDGSTTLTSGTDYTVAYSDNTNVGTATVTVTSKGNYAGTKTASFTIEKAQLTVTANSYTIVYGSTVPTFEATYTGFKNNDNASVLTTQPSFSCTATSTSAVGQYDINVSGAAAQNYDISYVKGVLTINAKSASDLTISDIAAVTYNRAAQTPAVTVKDGSTTLTSGTDYTVAYSNNTNAGTATVTVTGKGNYTGTKTASFTINAKSASNLTISDIAAVTYNGAAQTPAITVKDGTTTLTCGTDYTVAYSNNTNVGTATVTVTGKGNYTGTKSANFTINASSASNFTISDIAAVTYNGTAQTPAITVKDGSMILTSETDYTVAYSNNTNAGTATVTVTGIGNYTGTKTASFTINAKSVSDLTISDIAAVTYTGSAITPSITVKDGSTTLTSGTDYTVAYSNNINAGTATVIITGKGNYTGTKTTTFIIFRVITFADSQVKDICVTNWDQDGDHELSETEAAAVTDLGTIFKNNKNITSFNELQYFTGLTSIGNYAFYYCTGLTSVTIPNSVTSIGNYAFQYCSGLTSVTIPNSVTTIGNYAFSNCSGLTSVTIPNSVTSIGSYAFNGCSSLTSVTIPNSVTSIGGGAFSGCRGLTSVTVASGNTKYDSRDNCNAIIETSSNTLIAGCKNTVIPNSVTSIGSGAFSGCSGLTSIDIPNSVTSIDSNAFSNCSDLTSVTIPNSVTSIGGGAFARCSSLTSVTIPNTVTQINNTTFLYCSGLTSVTIGNSVTSIGDYAFMFCSGLTSVTIGNSVTSIGNMAFCDCSSLTSITIPNSVTSIDVSAFSGCRSLTKVKVENATPASISSSSFLHRANATLYVPKGSSSSYASASYWSDFGTIKEFPDGDVNDDGKTNVVDVVDLARFVVGTPRDVFDEFLADINSDEEINIADAVVLVNEIAGDTQFAKPAFAPRKAASDVLTLFGDGSSLSLQMEGNGGYSAFQFDLWIPTDMDMMQVSLNEARRQGHQLLYNKVGDGHYRVVALSTSGNVFSGSSGELLSMTLDDFATDDVRIDNIHFVTARGIDVPFETLGISYNNNGITTGISSSPTEEENVQPVYNLNGQRLTAPRRGLNIVGGKIIIKK